MQLGQERGSMEKEREEKRITYRWDYGRKMGNEGKK